MNIYIIILLILHVLGLGFTLAKHGEPKDGEYNFFHSLIGFIVTWALLYYGGVFN